MEKEKIKMEQGKIYFISYGGNTQILGRYEKSDICQHFFYDLLHYWNGFESFRYGGQYCVTSGIEEIRPASQAEKMALVRFEIEHNCI